MIHGKNQDDASKFEIITPKCTLDEIELKPELRQAIMEVLDDRNYAYYLEKEGLKTRKRILLHGPPGCGKTSIAHAIAAETKLPLYLASFAQIQNCYVGESEKNIENVFKFAEKSECVMLIDEFDSYARDRGGGIHSYEKDLVNTVLVNLESRSPKGLVVCCTNFLTQIDPAIARRFDLILEVPQLSYEALVKVAEEVLKGRFGISAEECVNEGISPSGTVRAATNRLRNAVLEYARKKPKRRKPRAKKKLEPKDIVTVNIGSDETYGIKAPDLNRIAEQIYRSFAPPITVHFPTVAPDGGKK